MRADGELAKPPIALAEVQGYVYRARRDIADLFERAGKSARAGHLRAAAEDLRSRFERDFWSTRLDSYVLARAADGPCVVNASNAGQVLWSGIASDEHAAAVSKRMLAEDMFAGWGVRTLSKDAVAYNPIGYHLGTIWPHDNSLIAEGLRRYGEDDAAEQILAGLVEAANDFDLDRLPECLAGFSSETFGVPVRYPIACHPQAWAAGAVPHALIACLGLEPHGFDHVLRVVRPRLPSFVQELEIRGIPIAQASVDLRFESVAGRTHASVVDRHGTVEVEIEPE